MKIKSLFKNITINNCVVKPSVSPTLIAGRKEGLGGVALEIVDGGVMDGINVRTKSKKIKITSYKNCFSYHHSIFYHFCYIFRAKYAL